MDNTKFTKGTWKVDGYDIYSDNDINKELIEGNLICSAPEGFNLSMKNWKANAKLIAAAPEMFEILESVLKLKKDNYGDGMCTHINLIGKAKEIESLLNKITQ